MDDLFRTAICLNRMQSEEEPWLNYENNCTDREFQAGDTGCRNRSGLDIIGRAIVAAGGFHREQGANRQNELQQDGVHYDGQSGRKENNN